MRFPDLADAPVVETRVCQYESTPDSQFIIDRHPDFDNVWLVGGGSGHGFKHGPVIGRYVVGRHRTGRASGRARNASVSTRPRPATGQPQNRLVAGRRADRLELAAREVLEHPLR